MCTSKFIKNPHDLGPVENVASVVCLRDMPDLVFDHIELMRTAHLEDRQLYWLQCAMEENCVASQAYKIQKESENWHLETRRLLRFTARILNAGTADFRPSVPKHLWEWHMCHMWVIDETKVVIFFFFFGKLKQVKVAIIESQLFKRMERFF